MVFDPMFGNLGAAGRLIFVYGVLSTFFLTVPSPLPLLSPRVATPPPPPLFFTTDLSEAS